MIDCAYSFWPSVIGKTLICVGASQKGMCPFVCSKRMPKNRSKEPKFAWCNMTGTCFAPPDAI